jgi:hypothetical protein
MKRLFSILPFLFTATLSLSIPGYLYSQTKSDGLKPQYLFTKFSLSQIKIKNSNVLTNLMNYNIVTEKMVFIKNDQYFDLINPQMIDTIYLNDRVFIPIGKTFYEVLLSGPVSLFIQHRGELLPPAKPAGYGGTSQTSATSSLSSISTSTGQYNLSLPSDYTVNVTNIYWIRKDNEWLSFTNEKQFLKLFPEKSTQLKSFIKENHLMINNPEQIKKIVEYSNNMEVK